MEMLKARAGIDLLHVPFKGGGPATVALLAGEVGVMFGGNSVAGHIKSGKLRALAVAGKQRSHSVSRAAAAGRALSRSRSHAVARAFSVPRDARSGSLTD